MIEEYNLSVRLTPNQNILLCDIKPAWKQAIEAELTAAGIVPPSELDSLDRNAMACPALPLCGLAITEAERGLPDINRRVRVLLDKVGLPGETIVMRMTGCPNGCAPAETLMDVIISTWHRAIAVYMAGLLCCCLLQCRFSPWVLHWHK